jgi:hypothetical protein
VEVLCSRGLARGVTSEEGAGQIVVVSVLRKQANFCQKEKSSKDLVPKRKIENVFGNGTSFPKISTFSANMCRKIAAAGVEPISLRTNYRPLPFRPVPDKKQNFYWCLSAPAANITIDLC